MAQYDYFFNTVALNATGDTYWFLGAIGAGGVFEGAGFYLDTVPDRPTWDQAGWAWLFIVSNNTSTLMMMEQYPVFLGFTCGKLFDDRFRGSIAILRFVPVPWLGEYDLYGFTMERVL